MCPPDDLSVCQPFFTTEYAEINGSERNRTADRRRRMRPIIRRFRHSLLWAFRRLSFTMAKPSKSAAPRLKELRTEDLRQEAMQIPNRQRQSVRFRSHSFARSVADLDFSPNDNERRPEAQEREWAKNRIIGHGFRGTARSGWLIPFFPLPSAISVVKTQQEANRPLKTPKRYRFALSSDLFNYVQMFRGAKGHQGRQGQKGREGREGREAQGIRPRHAHQLSPFFLHVLYVLHG